MQIDKQEQNLDKYLASFNAKSPTVNKPAEPNPIPTQKNPFSHNNADQINRIPSKSLLIKASVKIPSLFIPHIALIERLTAVIDDDPHPITYTTTAGQDGGVSESSVKMLTLTTTSSNFYKSKIYSFTHIKGRKTKASELSSGICMPQPLLTPFVLCLQMKATQSSMQMCSQILLQGSP